MWAILTFFILVLVLYLGFGWLADNPGSVTFVWQGQSVEVSLVVFLVATLVFIGAVLVIAWAIAKFFQAPDRWAAWREKRSANKGHRYLTAGIMAAGAGNAAVAREMVRKSSKRVASKDKPLLGFLDAQTALIEGDHDRARGIFEEMERDPDTRLLALRGLFVEARRVNDEAAEQYYAERALRLAPNLPWAGDAVLERKSSSGDWDGALRVLEAQANTRLVDDGEAKRLRAVLLTAKAQDVSDTDPKSARSLGRKAQKLAPDFVPAALVAARAALRLNDTRRGARILETAWAHSPHPQVADAYVHARAGDSVEDRLKRARKLADMQSSHVEADLCLARAALDAGQLDMARTAALKAAEKDPREGVYLLLADIEEEQSGEVGRVREWLAMAIKARRDPAWMADGIILDDWMPLSPISRKLDAVEWKTPLEQSQGAGSRMIDQRPVDDRRGSQDNEEQDARRIEGQTANGAAGPVVVSDAKGDEPRPLH